MKSSTSKPGTSTGRRRGAMDRPAAILDAALRLAAQRGLGNVTTAAIAREAGIAAGTLFLYFETRETLINALYVDLVRRRHAAITAGLDEEQNDRFRTLWFNFARFFLGHPDVSNVIQQCEVSFVLTPESLAVRDEFDRVLREDYFPESDDLLAVPLRQQVFYALMIGPPLVLGHLREKREIPVTDDLLEETYRRVRRALED